MVEMSKNRDIRGFFGKKPSQASQPSPRLEPNGSFQLGSEPKHASKSMSVDAADSFLDLPSSPITPQKKVTRTPVARDTEIKGSDDEDDDLSDASFESFGQMVAKKMAKGPAAPVAVTPKAKRVTSSNFYHRSPLTLQQQPKHKFDLKALLNHARQEDATDESVRRAEAAMAQADDELELEVDPSKMAGKFLDGEDEVKKEKLAMAIDKTDGDESRPRAYFFDLDGPPRDLKRKPFPNKAVKSKPWSILREPSSRNQMFIHGLPTTLAKKGKELPDELYLWILDRVCVEKDLQLRNQYIELAVLCPDDTNRLVDGKQLYGMLESIGGQEHATAGEKFTLSPGLSDPYPKRDWSSLRYFLELLARLAPKLNTDSNLDAIKLLLRLSLDPVIVTEAGLQVAHSTAMLALISALPGTEARWESCCKNLCDYVYASVDEASQRSIVISLLPASTPRVIDLQRRMASEALLNEAGVGAKNPNESVTMSDIFRRLSEPDLQITSSTAFLELLALLVLLDIVIHDGNHLYRAQLPPSAPATAETEARSRYDADIDRVVMKLKVLHDKIADNTLIAKKEVKLTLDGMIKRLKNTVRSRPPPKISIFEAEPEKDKFLPRQKDFMKKWAAATVKPSAEE